MAISYTSFLDLASRVLLVLAAVAAVVCAVDWAIRARHISPFNPVARFFRRTIDPLLRPLEVRVVRAGGQPASTPLWVFVAIMIVGILVLQLLRFAGGLIMQISVVASEPRMIPGFLIGWIFRFLMIALIVRTVSSWLPISPFSRWIRWSFVSTEWLVAPLRRFIPALGAIDVTPMVAYFILWLAKQILGV